MAAFRGVRNLERALGVDVGGVVELRVSCAGCDALAAVALDFAGLDLDCCASCSGTEAGAGVRFFGGLVSCSLGSVGDWIGRVIEVSGAEALRGAVGGWEGSVYDWKAEAKGAGVDENWRARLRRQEKQTVFALLANNLGPFMMSLFRNLCGLFRGFRRYKIHRRVANGYVARLFGCR